MAIRRATVADLPVVERVYREFYEGVLGMAPGDYLWSEARFTRLVEEDSIFLDDDDNMCHVRRKGDAIPTVILPAAVRRSIGARLVDAAARDLLDRHPEMADLPMVGTAYDSGQQGREMLHGFKGLYPGVAVGWNPDDPDTAQAHLSLRRVVEAADGRGRP